MNGSSSGLLIAAFFCLLLTNTVSAQTQLRWKFTTGDAFLVEAQQDTDSQVAFSGKSAATKIHLSLTLGWKVTGAEGDRYSITQSIDRIAAKLTAPPAATIEYDSASSGRVSGQAKELAESLQPLVGAEFETVMTSRGEFVSVKPANDAAKSLVAKNEKQAAAGTASIVEQVLRQPLVVFPEGESVKSWSVTTTPTTAAGPIKVNTTYTLVGKVERDGQELQKISSSTTLETTADAKTRIKPNEQSGEILFSAELGRVVESTSSQKLITERPYRETTIVVTLTSSQKTDIKAAMP